MEPGPFSFLLAAIAGLCIAAAPAHAAEREARVLVLNGADAYNFSFLISDGAMRASLSEDPARRILFFSEPLDAQRFPIAPREAELVSSLATKYAGLRIDVVVAVTLAAVEFFKQHGEALWPGARLVVQSIPRDGIEPGLLPPGATGVTTREDVDGTLKLARRLQPGARRILVVAGVSDYDRRLARQARDALSAPAGSASVEFLTGWPLPELLARVAAASADTIVLYLTQFRDRDGQAYAPSELARAIARASAVPVYGPFEAYIGAGAVAGSMESFADTGRLVGEQVRAVLAGGPPAQGRALLEVPSRCMADARALQRWSLDAQLLPEGCELRFADRPIWRQYLWQIGATLAVIIVQGILIAALFVQRRRRRLAEEAVQKQRGELAHASRLAVAGELTAAISHEINQPLGAILSNVEAADLLIQSGEDRRELLLQILADIRRDDLRASEVIRRMRTLLARHESEQSPLDINLKVTEVAALLHAEAERRGVTIDIQLAPGARMLGDRVQIQQVLINLLLNAMDAVGDAGEDRQTIVVTVASNADRVAITVRDRGHGITPEQLPKLFESFYSTKRSGMGLGLSIAHTIVKAHGGRIWAESRPGDGAAFHIEFPAMEPSAEGPRSGAVS